MMVALAVTVLLGVSFRFAGSALVWYDEVAANTLNVASSAKVEGNLKTNALSIDLGAEVSGSITRIS